MAYRPRDWSPLHLETVLHVPPDGEPTRSATMLRARISPDHHLVAIDRRVFHADARDVYPFPNWREERARDEAGEEADRAWDEENAESFF